MGKGIICFISLFSMFFSSGCGNAGFEDKSQLLLPTPEPPPIEIVLDVDALAVDELTIEELLDIDSDSIEIYYSPSTGIPWQIDGNFTSHTISSDQDAVIILLILRSIFQIPDDCSFSCVSYDNERNSEQVYTLNQLYKGVLVDGAQFRIIATEEGIPVSVSGSYLRPGDVDINNDLSAVECFKTISTSCNKSISSVSLVIRITEDGNSHLCWKYEDIFDSYYVDAHTGDLLVTIPTAIF